jgi:NAD(P)H dehydrogenase (quinone)
MTRPARIAVVYYSATGNVHRLAHALAEGAGGEGAEVRIRHVEELASELVISQNQYWGRHRSEVEDEPVASLEDLEWADGVAFGTPTRFGNVAAQLKQFMDQAGRLWQEGKLADKVATAFTASMTTHGGQESTILALSNTLYHWGMLILPLGYTASEVFNAGATRMAPRTRAGRGSRDRTRKRLRSPATRASVSPAMPRSSPPPARRTPSASSGRGRSASRRPRSTESAMRSTGGRTYRASHFLWSPRGETLTPLRDLWLSLDP